MPLNFDKHAQKGNKFLKELADELGNKTDTQRAGKILRAVFRTLRNHITLEENFQLLSQLPTALKGVYVESWSPSKKQSDKSRKKNDFIMEMLKNKNPASLYSVSEMKEGTKEINAVLKVMKKYVSDGEFQDIESVLPRQLKQLLRESIHTNKLNVRLISNQ